MIDKHSVLCTFDKKIGWRIVGTTLFFKEIQVVIDSGRKVLRIPSLLFQRKGWFCNPKKICLHFIRNVNSQYSI